MTEKVNKETLVKGAFLEGDPRGGAFRFVVEPFTEDYTGRLAWHFLGNHLLRCASLHAGLRGFGYEDMQKAHHAWVLSRLSVQLEEMPRTGEEYVIETWVARIYRQFTDRHYAITGADGRVYGYAASTWALIDVDTRLPMDLDTLPDGGFTDAVIDREAPIPGFARIRLTPQATVAKRHDVVYTDLDINGHVNSIRYIEMMLDLFPADRFAATPVRRLDVAYNAESHFGDSLELITDTARDGREQVEIRKAGGGPVVKAAIGFAS